MSVLARLLQRTDDDSSISYPYLSATIDRSARRVASAHGQVSATPSPFRRLMSLGMRLAARVLLGLPFPDTQCGFKLFRADVAQDLFSRMRINGFSFDVEVLLMAQRRGYRIDEERLRSLRVPGLVLMDVRGFRHFVVLKQVVDDHVEVGDPILGNRSVPFEEFLEAWPSRAVFVVIGSDFDRNTVLLEPSARPSARALLARQSPISDAELLDFGFTHADLF